MLVLTRKVGQVIRLGDDIFVTLVAIRGGSARLGIVAPEEVLVDRQEVHEKRKDSPNNEAGPDTDRPLAG
jgi:carbon storage regulator